MLKDLKSELGQKRQFDPLPATTVCPYERTSSDRLGMSQRCRDRTHALQQTPASFDYFVGPDKRCGLEPHAELGGYLQV